MYFIFFCQEHCKPFYTIGNIHETWTLTTLQPYIFFTYSNKNMWVYHKINTTVLHMKSAVLWTLHVYRSSCLGHRRSWCGDGGTAQAVSQTDSCTLTVWAGPRGWRGHMGWAQSSHQSLPAGHSRRLTEPKTLGSLSKATSAPLICIFWIQPVKDVLTGNAKLLKVPVYIKQKKENGNIIHHMQNSRLIWSVKWT